MYFRAEDRKLYTDSTNFPFKQSLKHNNTILCDRKIVWRVRENYINFPLQKMYLKGPLSKVDVPPPGRYGFSFRNGDGTGKNVTYSQKWKCILECFSLEFNSVPPVFCRRWKSESLTPLYKADSNVWVVYSFPSPGLHLNNHSSGNTNQPFESRNASTFLKCVQCSIKGKKRLEKDDEIENAETVSNIIKDVTRKQY